MSAHALIRLQFPALSHTYCASHIAIPFCTASATYNTVLPLLDELDVLGKYLSLVIFRMGAPALASGNDLSLSC